MSNYAAIDIGTNTLLMLIAEVNPDSHFRIISDEHHIARLGDSVSQTKIINQEAIQRAISILKSYSKICLENEVHKISVVGTAVFRNAENGEEVRQQLSEVINSEIKIISGEEEARLSFLGTVNNDYPTSVLDIGGGSTELIFGEGNKVINKHSYPIGAVSITENFFPSHPPLPENLYKARKYIKDVFSSYSFDNQNIKSLYAVAGTPTTLAAVSLGILDYEPELIDNYKLTLGEIDRIIELFLNSSLNEITNKFYVHPLRADVITAGAIILKNTLDYLKLDHCIVSIRGLRYGVLKQLIIDN
jgi:exopolyphosphatase / guanosine-5'-triphosphate,3'-diphosphate pyrophosphatase